MNEKFLHKNLKLDMLTKKSKIKKNPVTWDETKCCLCNFNIGLGTSKGPKSEEMTYLDYVIKKEHCFIRNIFDPDHLSQSKNLKSFETYFESFKLLLRILALLDNVYTNDSDIEDISHECLVQFLSENDIEIFEELFLEVSNTKIENVSTLKNTKLNQIKLISYVYGKIMKFPDHEFKSDVLVTKNFFDRVLNLPFGDVLVHHLDINGEIIGFEHDFCNRKLKENQSLIPAIAHNLFKFDFFF